MGKSIRIYLADADPSGVRHAEIVNWSGQALAFPRNKVRELKQWPEISKQGVYFLFGQDEKTGLDAVYIGETEVVIERILQHLSQKDFWLDCIAFTSKDENLTKSHIKYLESKFVAAATAASRYVVMNSSTPQESALPRADRDAMDKFYYNAKILLGVLGHRLLDPLQSRPEHLSTTSVANEDHCKIENILEDLKEDNHNYDKSLFFIKSGEISASAILSGNEIIVLENSQAVKKPQIGLPLSYKELRSKLIKFGVLKEMEDHFVFTRNYSFSSPSQAGSIVIGASINGRIGWKDIGGKSIKEIEKENVD